MTEWEEQLENLRYRIPTDSLSKVYSILSDIVKKQPELSSEVMETFKIILQNKNNDAYSLSKVYSMLANIVKEQPELSSEVFETYKIALQNEDNYGDSLSSAYTNLGDIAKQQPDLSSEVFEVLKQAIPSENNNAYSWRSACPTMVDIVQAQPDLAPEVMKIVFQKEFNYAINSPELVLEVCSKCMKGHKPEDFAKDIEQTAQNTQMLQAAYKCAFLPKKNLIMLMKIILWKK